MPIVVTPGWKTLLEKHDKLVAKSNVTLFDRVKLLKEVFDDPSYKMDCRSSGRRETEMLDLRLTDTCASFGDLHRTIKLYPNRDQWKNGNLSRMIIDAAEVVRAEARERNQALEVPGSKDQKLSWKQRALVAEGRVRELEGEVRELKAEVRTLRDLMKPHAG